MTGYGSKDKRVTLMQASLWQVRQHFVLDPESPLPTQVMGGMGNFDVCMHRGSMEAGLEMGLC